MAFGKKAARIKELDRQLEEAQAQLGRLKNDNLSLNSISGTQRAQIENLTDENRRKSQEIQRLREMERLLNELKDVLAREKRVKESVVKLIVNEESLISLIAEAKRILAEIMNLLRHVLEVHPNLKGYLNEYLVEYRKSEDTRKGTETINIKSAISDLRYQLKSANRWDLGREENAKTETRLLISIAGSFMVLYNAVHSLTVLVNEEKRAAVMEKACDDLALRYMQKIFGQIYHAVRSSMPMDRISGYSTMQQITIELSDEEIKTYSKEADEAEIIRQLNRRIMKIIPEMLQMMEDLRYCIKTYGDVISKPYQEFARIKQNLLGQLQRLFRIFVENINKNAELVDYIIEMNEKKIVEAQNEFNAFLRHSADYFDESIRQMEFDFMRSK